MKYVSNKYKYKGICELFLKKCENYGYKVVLENDDVFEHFNNYNGIFYIEKINTYEGIDNDSFDDDYVVENESPSYNKTNLSFKDYINLNKTNVDF